MRLALPATCALVAALLAPTLHADDRLGPVLDKLTQTLQAEVERRQLPGLSVAIVRDRDVVYRHAFGYADLARQVPASLENVYPVGSITKVFVATMLMQLVERGVVRLDDPVTKYVPEYRVKSSMPATQPTTLRQLASHCSGLPRDAGVNFWMNYTMAAWMLSGGQSPMRWYASKSELLDSLPTVELEYPPYSQAVYSNLGMSILGIALERASGEPFGEYLDRHVLRPVGMTSAGLLTGHPPARMPVGYVPMASRPEPLIAPPWQLGIATYTGGLFGTAEDFAKFVSLQFQEGPETGAQILSGDSLRQMRTPAAPGGAGLGWWTDRIEGHTFFEHSGGHVGFIATVGGIPDLKLGVVLMANSFNPVFGPQPTMELARMLYPILIAASTPPPGSGASDTAKPDLSRYAGLYTVAGNFAQIRIDLEDGQLWFTLKDSGSGRQRAYVVGPSRLSLDRPEGPPAVTFDSDPSGRITALGFALFRFVRVEGD